MQLFERWRTKPALERLDLAVPEGFAEIHGPLLDVCTELLAERRPVRILEYGAGEAESDAEAGAVSALCKAVAEQSGGQWLPVAFSETAAKRVGSSSGLIDGGVTSISALRSKGPIDLFVFQPVRAFEEAHPLSTFWAFIAAELLAAETRAMVFLDCISQHGNRCAYLRDYLERMGVAPTAFGGESAWRYRRPVVKLPEGSAGVGHLKPLGATLDAGAFLRLFDRIFAPLLFNAGHNRDGTFRSTFEALLAKQGPYVIIETGTTRPFGDFASNGQSTVLFDLLVNCFGGRVTSVDIDPNSVKYCREKVSERVTVYCADSVTALAALNEVSEAHLIYLDSYDFDPHNPHPSSLHHIYELAAIWGRTRPGTLLVIDDCFGADHGKHAYVSRFLKSVGIRPLFAGYQTAWVL